MHYFIFCLFFFFFFGSGCALTGWWGGTGCSVSAEEDTLLYLSH